MKKRLKSWITSVIGILILLAAIAFIYIGKTTVIQSIPLFALGWVFLSAKDSLLEGLSMGILKMKKE